MKGIKLAGIILILIALPMLCPTAARAACGFVICGDGIMDVGESCDDGNTLDGDGCGSDCQVSFDMTVGLPIAGYTTDDGFPRSMSAADLNNDGITDFIVSAFRGGVAPDFQAHLFSYLVGADGAITQAGRYRIGSNPGMIDTGELNGDHNIDVVSVDFDTWQMHIFFGNGDGTLRLANVFTPGDRPRSVVIADINSDGFDDIISGVMNDLGFRIYYGDGSGGFPSSSFIPVGSIAALPEVKDLNGDGYNDLILSSYTIDIYHGGPFGLTKVQSLPYFTINPRTADLNLDGYEDMLSYGSTGGTVSTVLRVFLNNGDGTFSYYREEDTGYTGFIMALGDLDNDGNTDWAITTRVATISRVYLGDGKGWYKSHFDFTLPDDNDGVIMLDLNRDGTLDLLSSLYYTKGLRYIVPIYNYNLFQFPNCGDGRISRGETCDDGNRANGDGCSDACRLEWTDDTDRDGLLDYEEIALGTDPRDPDTDGDCALDGAEHCAGQDPSDPSDQAGCLAIQTPIGNWRLLVTLLDAPSGHDISVSLAAPRQEQLIRHSLKNVGKTAQAPVTSGDGVELAITVNGQYTYLSSSDFGRVRMVDAYHYQLSFETLPLGQANWDFEDLQLSLEFLPRTPAVGTRTNVLGEFQATAQPDDFSPVLMQMPFDGNVEFVLPAGGVESSEGVMLTAGMPRHYAQLRRKWLLGGLWKLQATNGLTALAGGKAGRFTATYPDANQDGIVDGSPFFEYELGVYRYNEHQRDWERMPTQINYDQNTVAADVREFSVYAIGGHIIRRPDVDDDINGSINHPLLGCSMSSAPAEGTTSNLALLGLMLMGTALAFRRLGRR